MPVTSGPFVTTVVGSMPKRQWLYKRGKVAEGAQFRYGKEGAWTLDGEALSRAKDDAARVTIRVQERAGIDIISDGEQRREHYLVHLTQNMGGFDYRNLVEKPIRGRRSRALVGQ